MKQLQREKDYRKTVEMVPAFLVALGMVGLPSQAKAQSPPPPTAPAPVSEARPVERCAHHTRAFTGCKEGFSLYYTDRFYRRQAQTRINQGYTTSEDVALANGHFTAHTDCSRVGDWALLSLNGRPPEWHLILDCSQPYHAAWHVAEGRVAEVGAKSFVENGCARRLSGDPEYLDDGSCPARLITVSRRPR
jgi:hypothetical protein